jgi:protein SCO1/2
MLTPTHASDPAAIPAPAHVDSAGERFLTGPGLLVFLVTALAAYEGFLLLTIFGPTEGGLLGDFVRDFQLWCYRGDPRTGGISWLAVSVMMLEPVFIVAAAALLWRRVLTRLGDPRLWLTHARAAMAGFGVIAVCVAGLVAYARLEAARVPALPPFPGERIRVNLAVSDAPLVDQRGMDFRLADLRGEVVLVTGVYAACSTTCSEIFMEVQALLAELTPAERGGLKVVALSLNPEYETTEIMAAMAEGRGFAHPEFRYVNGRDPAEMHGVLQRLQFAVTRNPQTGVLDHANLFLLIDRSGRIAYRFTLDPRHRAWLREGLRQLLLEPHALGPAQ